MNSEISMYAGDHQIYQIDKNITSVANKLKKSAKCATDWYDNHLEGNLDKYQTLYITKKYLSKDKNKDKDDQSNNPNTSRPASINLKGTEITISDSLIHFWS